MRIIKFRGKSVDNVWQYGDLYQKDSKTFIHTSDDSLIEVLPDTVCQFINLYDSNNNEIYEGDLIKDLWESINIVKWEQEKVWLMDINGDEFQYSFNRHGYQKEDIKVIGNIYDDSVDDLKLFECYDQ